MGVKELFLRGGWSSFCVGVASEGVGGGAVLGTQRGEIPAASAGMTGLSCAGVKELFCVGVASESVGGGGGAWRSARRDTRGERGYDGAFLRGYDGGGTRTVGLLRGGGEAGAVLGA